jgi:hypothetical protein
LPAGVLISVAVLAPVWSVERSAGAGVRGDRDLIIRGGDGVV